MQELGGVPRCIFGNFNGYVRALEIANSPNIGVCLCCGTWMEGGKGMGKDVFEAARAFAGMGSFGRFIFAMCRLRFRILSKRTLMAATRT
jgi:mannonate dehydratase